jgi:hypothetical protein
VGGQRKNLSFEVKCTQVPEEAGKDTFCFIWLGSDNNKGMPTNWKQGLRAFGVINSKRGGPGYNDEWELKVRIHFVFEQSINKTDLLEHNPALYTEISGMPIIGLSASTNQTVQMIRPDGKGRQNIGALFALLNSVNKGFIEAVQELELVDDYLLEWKPTAVKREKNAPKIWKTVGRDTIAREATAFDEPEDKGTEVITHPFDPTKIDIRPQPLTIISIIKRLESNPVRLDLNTEFQRGQDLWSLENQSRLIESLLVRIPLPAFYFDGTSEKWLIVDGLQRISSLRNFILLKKFKLTGLEYLIDFEGFGWDDLPSYLKSRIEETAVTAYIINPGTPEEVKFNIFKRINTSGLSLNPQEIRNALNNGVPSKFIADLAKEPLFIKAMGGKVPTVRMQDKDYVTRFVGFYLDEENYQPDLDTFLNSGMSKLKKMDEAQLERIASDFNKAMKFAQSIFGDNAFRKVHPAGRRMPINKALFECTSVILAKMKYSDLLKLETKRGLVTKEMGQLVTSNKAFIDAISSGTGDIKSVQDRYSLLREVFKTIII